jgi:hypothetical protein
MKRHLSPAAIPAKIATISFFIIYLTIIKTSQCRFCFSLRGYLLKPRKVIGELRLLAVVKALRQPVLQKE